MAYLCIDVNSFSFPSEHAVIRKCPQCLVLLTPDAHFRQMYPKQEDGSHKFPPNTPPFTMPEEQRVVIEVPGVSPPEGNLLKCQSRLGKAMGL